METNELQTKYYGLLHGVARVEYDRQGNPLECTLTEENPLETPCGLLVPQYEEDGVRRKFIHSLEFYGTGELKSISLQKSSVVQTPLGALPAELITFYKSGAIKRIFPLNGKISGFWSEGNEYRMAQELVLNLPIGKTALKFICLYFYESGALKSFTMWPRERLSVTTKAGAMELKAGVSFYESGEIKSLEPRTPTRVSTPIGTLTAFDRDANGICADQNSLSFEKSGAVLSLKTESDAIEVTLASGQAQIFTPTLCMSHFSDDACRVEPLLIRFSGDKVYFNETDSFEISTCRFAVSAFLPQNSKVEDGCPGCGRFRI